MKDANNIYYLFSTAAQSIAAFIGLLIAGYTLVLSMMEAAARFDESLEEVHAALRIKFHRDLRTLSVITAFGIVGCLLVLFANRYEYDWFPYLALAVMSLVVASIFGGVWFVIRITNPEKYQIAAREMAKELRPSPKSGSPVSKGDFLETFIEIEQLVRSIWQSTNVGQRPGQGQYQPSFREMVEMLNSQGILTVPQHERILSVTKHRNVVVHGQVDFVDPSVFKEAQVARDELKAIDLSHRPAVGPT